VGGLHGTGKTTVARILANSLGLRYFSAGELFRQMAKERDLSLSEISRKASKKDDLDKLVDDRTREEVEKDNVVVEGLLSSWIAGKKANLRFYLYAPDDVRILRIAKRDNCSVEEARNATLFRENLERRRFKKFYAIDIDDYSTYDLTLNTALLSSEGNVRILECFARAYGREQGVK
jgi:cytidylate kinase